MDTQKGIAVLGSTGSIGVNTLSVIASHPEKFAVLALAARSSVDKLEEQVRRFRPRFAVLFDENEADVLRDRLADLDVEVDSGLDGLCRAAAFPGVELVMSAVVGSIGLWPTLRAVEAGKDVALANKESLVMAGELVIRPDTPGWGKIIPVDSEHNAIFQVLQNQQHSALRRILLTASGGPFLDWSLEDMRSASVVEALEHPNWKMGPKVTVDSATMMNKGLELIEAHRLFGVPVENLQIVVHPESIVHSMVEFHDGSVLAQLSVPDMRVPISYALAYPQRLPNSLPSLDLFSLRTLHFQPPDHERFPCLQLAIEAVRCGGTMPAVLNAANEVAVQAFLEGSINFLAIPKVIETVMARHNVAALEDISVALEADRWARDQATMTARACSSPGYVV